MFAIRRPPPAIHETITGSEDLHDLSEPNQALAQFCRAFNPRLLEAYQQAVR